VVVGPPGCGKSSLVRAGLLPVVFSEPGRWALPRWYWYGGRPLKALATAFAEAGVQTRPLVGRRERLTHASLGRTGHR
jgi:hypothetical protein